MADFAVFQIEITKGYDMSAFREAVYLSWGRQLAISGEFIARYYIWRHYIGMTTSLPKWFLSFRKNNLLPLKKFTLSELNPISKAVHDRTFNCSGKQKIFLILQDMKKMLTKAGGNEERTVFLFSDTQIKDCGGMTFTCRIRLGFIQRWSLKMASCSCQSNLFVVGFSGIAVAPRFAVFRNHRFSHDPTWFSCWCLVSLFVGLNRRFMSEKTLAKLAGVPFLVSK